MSGKRPLPSGAPRANSVVGVDGASYLILLSSGEAAVLDLHGRLAILTPPRPFEVLANSRTWMEFTGDEGEVLAFVELILVEGEQIAGMDETRVLALAHPAFSPGF